MAYENPLVPTVNFITRDPNTNLLVEGEVNGLPPAGAAYGGIFALNCELIRTDISSGTYINTGTVAVPAWTLDSAGGGIPGLPFNSIQYNNSGTFGGSANNIWDNINNRIVTTGIVVGTVNLEALPGARISALQEGGASIIASRASGGFPASFSGISSRGTLAAPTTNNSGDSLTIFSGFGYDSFNVLDTDSSAFIAIVVDGAPGVGFVPGQFIFATKDVAGVPTNRMFIRGSGFIGINQSAPVGTEIFGITGDAYVSGKLTVVGVIDPTAVILSGGTSLYFESNDGSTAPVSGGSTGRIRYNNLTGKWQISTQGSAYDDIVTGTGNGITSINTDITAVQTLTVGTAGTDFAIVDNLTGDHKFNLPTASAVNRGALSSVDWTTFNNKFDLPTLTAGSVLFSNGVTIAEDNANFFFDDTSNFLGLGTNTPTERLHVVGNAIITGKLTVNGAIDPTSLTLFDAGNAAYIQSADGQSAVVSALNTGRIRYHVPTQSWQVSENGGPYTDLSTGGTVNSVASADGSILVTNPTTNVDLAVIQSPKWTTARTLSITGDLAYTSPLFDGTGNVTAVGTLATVNGNVGTFADATHSGQFTVNAKGLITAASNILITPDAVNITGGQALTKTDDTNVTLTLGGTPASALLKTVSLTLGWTGTLAATRGGTGFGAYAIGDILYADTISTLAKLPIGTNGQQLTVVGGVPAWSSGGTGTVTSFSAGNLSPLFTTSVATATTTPALSFALSNAGANTWFGNNTGGSTTPAFNSAGALTKVDDTNVTLTLGGTPATSLLNAVSLTLGWTGTLTEARGGTHQSTYATGDLLYASALNTLSKLPIGTNGQQLTVVGGVPAWSSGGTGTVTSVDGSGGTTGLTLTGGPITTSGTLTLGGILGIANGGTNNSTAYTAGSIIFSDGTKLTQDNANLFFDDTNNRLGLGTTTPATRLHLVEGGTPATLVAGTIASFVSSVAAGTNAYLNIQSGSAGLAAITFGNNTNDDIAYMGYNSGNGNMFFLNGASLANFTTAGLFTVPSLSVTGVSTFNGNVTIANGINVILNTVTGTKIGTATTQKLGFFNATPVVQQTGDIVAGLANLGLIVSGTINPTIQQVSLTGQTADIADTAFTTATAGLYRVSYYLMDTTADGTAGAVSLVIKYTDNSGAKIVNSYPVSLTDTTDFVGQEMIVRLNSGSITYGTTHTGSYGTSQYALYVTLEKLI